ncbi:hypothetical protein [Chenggangzhangella methanolivorans]|uniref:PIN domain-containing protein n=1 Tax=Chenggangzhangella methanolivorans TaxID=1437009 RepID=A0A9E6UGU0_9HYPH|nr:hypothetical protein [Chenggangzhangella methanolivorans]QZN99087.1 hypothetical protein K6K41_19875 [Chenggangzhangella methanolivorans]
MGLERWDACRAKWVLYQTQERHSEDCARFPYEALPRRIFLDTNVVNLLVRYSDQVFEQAPIDDTLDTTKRHDVEALMHVFQTGARADWSILASRKVLDEIVKTPDEEFKADLTDYAIELVSPLNDGFADRLGRSLVETRLLSAFPGEHDRELIGNAIGFNCDVFCTCDQRTIIRKRHLANNLPIRFLTPIEWWWHVKPWAGLWL